MSKEDVLEVEGTVIESLPNAQFEVGLPNGHKVLAYIAGKLRMNFIKIIPGDKVTLELSPYDLTKGRIIWRDKNDGKNKGNSINGGTNVVSAGSNENGSNQSGSSDVLSGQSKTANYENKNLLGNNQKGVDENESAGISETYMR